MKLSAVLLAGGDSVRMGRDKAIVTFRDKPLWRLQIDSLRSLEPAEILISARIHPAWRPTDALFVPDVPPSRGPLSGLTAAMNRMCGTHLLALAVDLPLMTVTHLRAIYRLITMSGKGVIPKIGSRFEPLAAIYPRESLPHLASALNTDDVSLQRVAGDLVGLGMLSVMPVSGSDRALYRNLNAPADIARFAETANFK